MPAFGPIKRRELIRNLRKLDFDGHIQVEAINIWSKGSFESPFQIHIKATLADRCLVEFCGKQVLIEKNGLLYDKATQY